MELQFRYLVLFRLFLAVDGLEWFWRMGKSSQEYSVNAGVPTLFLLYINDLFDDDICNIATYADNSTLYPKCDQASDLWQQLELAELESVMYETM